MAFRDDRYPGNQCLLDEFAVRPGASDDQVARVQLEHGRLWGFSWWRVPRTAVRTAGRVPEIWSGYVAPVIGDRHQRFAKADIEVDGPVVRGRHCPAHQ